MLESIYNLLSNFNFPWLLKMAWRDSRRNRGKLLLFVSSIVIGIAALVAINTFGKNLQKDINNEAKSLLACDLQIQTDKPVSDTLQLTFDSLGAIEQASSFDFASFVFFPSTRDSRLMQVKCIEGNYPFYGDLETTPTTAAISFRNKRAAIIEQSVMQQFGVTVGDSVRIGGFHFAIEGQIESVPGRSDIASSFAPLIMVPKAYFDTIKAGAFGGQVGHDTYFKFDENADVEALAEQYLDPIKENGRLKYQTVQSKKEAYGKIFGILTSFLNLVGFIALLLGCIGVASSVHIYIKDKLSSVAVLRCLGMSGGQAFVIFLTQITVMGLLGAMIGAAIGSLIQIALPIILGDFLPVDRVSTNISWSAIGQGIITGLTIGVLFALLPLVRIRKVSPLRSLRASYNKDITGRDPVQILVYALILLFILGFTVVQIGRNWQVIFFPIAIGIGLLALYGMAKLLTWFVKKFFPTKWSYVWRQSIANLFRPNNQTVILMIAIGLGTGLISTMFFTREMLMAQVTQSSSANQPNLIAFNINEKQIDPLNELADNLGLPVMASIPVLDAQIAAINGISVDSMLRDTSLKIKDFWLKQTHQISHRDTLMSTDEIKKGKWHTKLPNDAIYISMEKSTARRLKLEVGSDVQFKIKDKKVDTKIGSLRTIQQNEFTPNFPIVFPEGVLDSFPKQYFLAARSDSTAQALEYKRSVASTFFGVTVIDVGEILKIVDKVLEKVSFVIRFMALFSILTGIIVLISSIVLSKYQRIQESVLLRTIGASQRQILWINALEYFLLGSLATLTGMLLSIIGSFLLAKFAFKIAFSPNWLPPLFLFLGITLLTVIIGLINSREVLTKPPLEVLRKEV